MLALIAGRGALPLAVSQAQSEPPLICALGSTLPDHVIPDHVFDIEKLGGLLRRLRQRGIRQVCFCGAIDRPTLAWHRLDPWTLTLLPRILRALRKGDDGALRIAISVFEEAGFAVLAAHDAAPALLPPLGVLTKVGLGRRPVAETVARIGDRVSAEQASRDLGQACVIRDGQVIAREDDTGTDAMLATLTGVEARGGVLYKAPKPGQDRRADLPVIGPDTAIRAAELGLAGIVIEAGGVMVLDRARCIDILDAAGAFLWVRERPV